MASIMTMILMMIITTLMMITMISVNTITWDTNRVIQNNWYSVS